MRPESICCALDRERMHFSGLIQASTKRLNDPEQFRM
jgi:hypothetical protein